MAGYRIDRVSEDIKREIAAIMRELKDPRITGMLTVVNVEVSSDASYAKVYVAVKGLTSATGYIRREIGKRLHLRKTPELKFIADDSIEKGMGIAGMINKLSEEE